MCQLNNDDKMLIEARKMKFSNNPNLWTEFQACHVSVGDGSAKEAF